MSGVRHIWQALNSPCDEEETPGGMCALHLSQASDWELHCLQEHLVPMDLRDLSGSL